ncbi:MAG: PadR family transcriptional regulator [Candidatus Hodarchaeales archaeon]|jgi:DNA-binding PadR family transcriptional regulator
MIEHKNPFIKRLEKDSKGVLTTILILKLIQEEGKIWAYLIKKKLYTITNGENEIKNSSLYTILKTLEQTYEFLESKMEDRRRYYSLTPLGQKMTSLAIQYWFDLVDESFVAFQNLNVIENS